MIKRALTYFIMFAITLLPVQLLSANVKSEQMKIMMTHMQTVEVAKKCHHEVQKVQEKMKCCETTSYNCDNCSQCPSFASGFNILFTNLSIKSIASNKQSYIIGESELSGTSHKNLLRPPRHIS